MVPNSHMDTYACELERSYTETVGNGRMDGPSGVRSHPPTPTRLLFLKYRVRTGSVPDILNLVLDSRHRAKFKFSRRAAAAASSFLGW